MKFTSILVASAMAALMFACGGEKKTETAIDSMGVEATYSADLAASSIIWKGSMVGIKYHEGAISLKEGSITVKGNQVQSGSFTVDMKSIAPTDTNYNKEHTKESLIGHLSTGEFFLIDSFPTAMFVIKKAEGNTLIGDLTVRGKTNEEKVTDVVVTADSAGVKATGKLVFDRKKYGVAWDAPVKEVVLSNDIELTISLVGKK